MSHPDDLPDDLLELQQRQKQISEEFSYLNPLAYMLVVGGPLMIGALIFLDATGVTQFDVIRYIAFTFGGLVILAGLAILGVAIFHPKAKQLRAINEKIREHADF